LEGFRNSPATIRQVLETYRVVAVVGLSDKPDRPSHEVAAYLQSQGYRIVPINPSAKEILGERVYPDLLSVPHDTSVEIVDVFRRSDQVTPHVDEAVKIGAKVIWFQDGVVNLEAAERARDAGLTVVMDTCMLREHRRLFGD
jgi:predicted CoA-binding protein